MLVTPLNECIRLVNKDNMALYTDWNTFINAEKSLPYYHHLNLRTYQA